MWKSGRRQRRNIGHVEVVTDAAAREAATIALEAHAREWRHAMAAAAAAREVAAAAAGVTRADAAKARVPFLFSRSGKSSGFGVVPRSSHIRAASPPLPAPQEPHVGR